MVETNLVRTEKISQEHMVKLYNSIIVPQMGYVSPVWQIANCGQLETSQRKSLTLCLGYPNTASCEALEVQAGVLLLDLGCEEISIRESSKIMTKPSTEKTRVGVYEILCPQHMLAPKHNLQMTNFCLIPLEESSC